ncbi:hypothetical protein F4801DRAFT_551638 [Xylaria longipes]|nr:hypothetical protein F4801DRAFT_551638 [Xylaria longipes]
MENDVVFQFLSLALQSSQGQSSARCVEPEARPQVLSPRSPISQTKNSSLQPNVLEAQEPKTATQAKSANSENNTTSDEEPSEPPRAKQKPIVRCGKRGRKWRLQREREAIAEQVIDHLLPRIERAAAEAAEREIDRLIDSAGGETTREKMQAILARVNELTEDELETLFLRSAVMASALRTVLRKVELEDAVAQWEDLAPGY